MEDSRHLNMLHFSLFNMMVQASSPSRISLSWAVGSLPDNVVMLKQYLCRSRLKRKNRSSRHECRIVTCMPFTPNVSCHFGFCRIFVASINESSTVKRFNWPFEVFALTMLEFEIFLWFLSLKNLVTLSGILLVWCSFNRAYYKRISDYL